MANGISYQKAFEMFKASGFSDSDAHKFVGEQVSKGLVNPQKQGDGVAKLVTHKKYNKVYLAMGRQWIALNSGSTLSDQGRAELAKIRSGLAALDENTVEDVTPAPAAPETK